MEQIALPEPRDLATTLEHALNTRASVISNHPGAPLSLGEYGTLFGLSLRAHADTHKRRYPSGGALYPIEGYMICDAIDGTEPGIFHYNPTRHVLERLWELPESVPIKNLVPQPEDHAFSSLLVFTSVWQRSSAKYGDLTYSHALLEAGHMSENVLLVATALGIRARPMAGFRDDYISKLLDLNDELEQPVHTITLTKPLLARV